MLIGDNGMTLEGDGRGGLRLVDVRDRKGSAMAAEELRRVARFLDGNAEAIVGDLDSTCVTEDGLHFEFDLLRHDSIATLRVTKEHIVMDRSMRQRDIAV